MEYYVTYTAKYTVCVDANSEDEAIDIADSKLEMGEFDSGDFAIEEEVDVVE